MASIVKLNKSYAVVYTDTTSEKKGKNGKPTTVLRRRSNERNYWNYAHIHEQKSAVSVYRRWNNFLYNTWSYMV